MMNHNGITLTAFVNVAGRTFLALFTLFFLNACSTAPHQASLEPKYDVLLQDKLGNSISIGSLRKNGSNYEFLRDDTKFKDFFLSMKEMKCLEGAEIVCHIHYPYQKENITQENSLVWLSHELLFMYKRPDQFGAQLWQGIYFDITPDENGFSGVAYSIDLNELASPPSNFSVPPINVTDLETLEVDERWLPFLKIKAT